MATTMPLPTGRPRWFFWSAVALLLWALIGVAALIAHLLIDEAALGQMPPADAAAFRALPWWFAFDFALGTIASLLGAAALVRGRKNAVQLSLIGLAALIVQFGYVLAFTDLIARKGVGATVLPVLILFVASVQLWLARTASARGWLI